MHQASDIFLRGHKIAALQHINCSLRTAFGFRVIQQGGVFTYLLQGFFELLLQSHVFWMCRH